MHRILVRGWQAELYFGDEELLVPAKHLVNDHSVVWQPVDRVEYFHILFDQHEVIFSDGAATESFYPGDQIMHGDAQMRSELESLFPELFDRGTEMMTRTARRTVRYRDAAVLRQVL
jgi:hypothetical protein